ncbi:MAG TPA: peptidase M16, partial [Acidobacteriota bacterium]|nr:peptidase M16 [Acidobacteriota bacterium]
LKSAKNRIKFNSETAEEQGIQIAYSLVRFMLMNEMSDRGHYLDEIEKLNSSDIRKAAGQYLSQKGKVVVKILPEEKK